MKTSYLIATVSAFALLGACSNAELIKQTEQTSPTGSSFAKDSYAEYLKLAKSEEDQGDHSSAKHYLTKPVQSVRLADKVREILDQLVANTDI